MVLAKTLIEHLTTRFEFKNPNLEPIDSGEENRNYKITVPHYRFLLRVYSRDHSTTGSRLKSQIEQEHRFINHLAGRGVPTPLPVKNLSNEAIFECDSNRFATLFEFVDGRHPAEYRKEIANQVGQLLRQIREASKSFQEKPTRNWDSDTTEHYLQTYYSIKSKFSAKQRSILNKLAGSVEASLDEIKQLERGFIHGDVKLGNLLFSADSELSAVIDFDDFRKAYFIAELTRTLMHDLHNPQQNAIRSGNASAMIDAYRPNDDELKHLNVFLKARFLYDVGSYIHNDLDELVDALLNDQHIKQLILRLRSRS